MRRGAELRAAPFILRLYDATDYLLQIPLYDIETNQSWKARVQIERSYGYPEVKPSRV